MLFSTPIFLFGFLPVVLLTYYLSPRAAKNIVLLCASLFFYAWGELFYLAVMLVSIGLNYVSGLAIAANLERNKSAAKVYLGFAVAANLALLGSFKYAGFFVENWNSITQAWSWPAIELEPLHLPLGISFFTFQAISYIVDVYRREAQVQKNLFNLALYISLFPQLIAGPIVRYHDVALQITERKHNLELAASGVRRFIYGLSKKMLIANPLGEVADGIFTLQGGDLTTPLAWVGILCYSLQIYFDFSAYSDMAIGLGRLFGFRFLENFNYPYISSSVKEFWRRWHISLSTWFRDYLYIPLGGNRVSRPRMYVNLFTVFLLTGFWHGAGWNFIVWGLFHGCFLALENAGLDKLLLRLWRPLRHAYVLLVVIIAWVFFRAETLDQALFYLGAMFGQTTMSTSAYQWAQIMSVEFLAALAFGLLLSLPIRRYLSPRYEAGSEEPRVLAKPMPVYEVASAVLLLSLLGLAALKVASSSYNPFIYFRF